MGVHISLRGQRAHGLLRQRRQPQPPGGALRGQVTQDHAERMVVGQLVVTVGGQQQRPGPGQPPPGEVQQVDRGLVGPVHILDHRHGGGGGRVDRGQEGR